MRVFLFIPFCYSQAALPDAYSTNDTYGFVATEKMFGNIDRLKHSSLENFERMSNSGISEEQFNSAYRKIEKFVMKVITINQRLTQIKDCPFRENREEKETR